MGSVKLQVPNLGCLQFESDSRVQGSYLVLFRNYSIGTDRRRRWIILGRMHSKCKFPTKPNQLSILICRTGNVWAIGLI